MSIRVVGYDKVGRRITVDDGPARARVSGYGQGGTHGLTLIGGHLVQGGAGPVERQRQAEREFKARRRA